MKKSRLFVSLLTLAVLTAGLSAADIKPGDNPNDITTAIEGASAGDVILLERGKMYFTQSTIDVNVNLTIKADETTTGTRPIISQLIKEDGSKDQELMFVRADLTVENVHFAAALSGATPYENDTKRGIVWVETEGMRAEFRGCSFDDFEARTLQLEAPDMEFFAYDCIWTDDEKTGGPSEGRSLDIRQYGPDTLLLQNCSFVNVGDRWIRHLPSGGSMEPINYAKIDHCTFVNGINYRPAFDFGLIEELVFTNNIVANPGIFGTDFMIRPSQVDGAFIIGKIEDLYNSDRTLAAHRTREVYYDRSEGIVVLACHGVDSTGTAITMHNNNMHMAQSIIDKLAENDTLSVQKWMCTQFEESIEGGAEAAFTNKEIVFTDAPAPCVDEVDKYVGYWDQNPWLEMNRVHPDSIDLSYGTTADAYSEAENGFPLGDLNWYPEQKARWESGEAPVGMDQAVAQATMFLKQNYPNPFSNETMIEYQLTGSAKVSLDVLNIMGQKVCTLVNDVQSSGSHQVSWSGKNSNGDQLPDGVYIYMLNNGKESFTQRMTLLK